MHFAIFAEIRAVGVQNGASVVINARGATLEEGNDQGNILFFGEFCQALGGGAGNRFGKIEKFGFFAASKIFAGEKFVERDDLRTARGGFANFRFGLGEIFVFIGGATHLHQANGKLILHEFILTRGNYFFAEEKSAFLCAEDVISLKRFQCELIAREWKWPKRDRKQ